LIGFGKFLMPDSRLGHYEHPAEVCFEAGGRVRIEAIPHDRPEPPEAPPIGCVGCRKRLHGGEGFFVEVDDMERRGWGVGTQVVCGACMADVLRPRNIIEAVEAANDD
jgi:hypothetical protein